MTIDLSDPKIFELNDLSRMNILEFQGQKLFYMDDFYKYPDLVFQSFNQFTPPVWKSWEKPSRNMVDFEDRRHQLDHEGMRYVYNEISKLCGQKPIGNEKTIVTNYTRFKKCKNNNYIDYHWWPHHDAGFNGIVYFNDYGEEYDGTFLYHCLDESIKDNKPEHENPWTPKDKWEIIMKIKAKYNRFVMFDGSKYLHGMSIFDDRWFADDLKDAKYRMNQVLFFNDGTES